MKREPEDGVLSNAEQDTNGVREHYDLVLVMARKTAEELRAAQFEGLPRMSPSTAGAHARLSGLINAFAWANRALFNAARAVEAMQGEDDESLTDEVLL